MFIVHIFQTQELGRLVTWRLPENRGGMGDITASREGVVVTGHFDLRSPEIREAFREALAAAEAIIPQLQPGAPPPEKIETPAQKTPTLANIATELDETFRQTVLGAAIKQEAPFSVGEKFIHLQRKFATIARKVGPNGSVEAVFCGFCRKALADGDKGYVLPAGSVKQVGVYSPTDPNSENPPFIVEASVSPRTGTLADTLIDDNLFIHECAKVRPQEFRVIFDLPRLVEIKE